MGQQNASVMYAPPEDLTVNPYGSEAATSLAVSPDATMVAKDLYVKVSAAPGGVESYAITLRMNLASTALSCTISASATSCNNDSAVTIPAGSVLDMQSQRSGGASPNAQVWWGFRLTTP
jgi:hypothetical protein